MENIALQIPPKRPLGVTLAALLLGFWGTTVCLILVILALGWLDGAHVQFEIGSDILGLANVPLARGLWKLKPWAYGATIFLQSAMLLNCVVLTILLPISADTKALQSVILFPAIILSYFLINRNVRAAFRSSK